MVDMNRKLQFVDKFDSWNSEHGCQKHKALLKISFPRGTRNSSRHGYKTEQLKRKCVIGEIGR